MGLRTAPPVVIAAAGDAERPAHEGHGEFRFVRAVMVNRLGGTTGVTAGALVEITEAVLLATAVLVVSQAGELGS